MKNRKQQIPKGQDSPYSYLTDLEYLIFEYYSELEAENRMKDISAMKRICCFKNQMS